MSARRLVISLAVLSLALLPAAKCRDNNPPVVVSPADDSVVQAFEFTVQVNVGAGFSFDPASDVVLNFVPLPMTGTGPAYTATVTAGPPLQDDNVILVRAERLSDGQMVTVGSQFQWLPPKASAFEITDTDDLIGGPLAHSRLGDYMLENGFARFIIQDVAQRDLYSVGAFGGNLIDLESGYSPDKDNFIEIAPMLNIETVVNPRPS